MIFKDKYCCKILANETKTIKASVPCTTPQCLSSHPNFNLINHANCGSFICDRIVGGFEASLGQFPWMTLLQYRSTDNHKKLSFKCGGSLITKIHVLSAAHCVDIRGNSFKL